MSQTSKLSTGLSAKLSPAPSPQVRGPLIRYRVVAWIVGLILLTLVFVAMPLKYFADQAFLVEALGPTHGFAYMVYLVVVYLLSTAAGWSWKRTLGVMLAGTIPLLSFWVEHRITKQTHHLTHQPQATT